MNMMIIIGLVALVFMAGYFVGKQSNQDLINQLGTWNRKLSNDCDELRHCNRDLRDEIKVLKHFESKNGCVMFTVVLPGPIRSKKNNRVPRKRRTNSGKCVTFMAANDAYREWEASVRWQVKSQLAQQGITKPLDCQLKLTVIAYYKGQMPDLDAIHTAVMDCLEGYAWENDKQICRFSDESARIKDNLNPRTIVRFEEIPECC